MDDCGTGTPDMTTNDATEVILSKKDRALREDLYRLFVGFTKQLRMEHKFCTGKLDEKLEAMLLIALSSEMWKARTNPIGDGDFVTTLVHLTGDHVTDLVKGTAVRTFFLSLLLNQRYIVRK